MKLSRRLIAAKAVVAVGGIAYARWVEPRWFDLTVTPVRWSGAPRLKLLHLTDLHASDGLPIAQLAEAVRMGLARRPDLICFTGDFVTTTVGFDADGLRRILRMAADTAPCFAVLGNHDGGRWLSGHGGDSSTAPIRDLVSASGVRVLHNESAMFQGLRLRGVADLWSGEFLPSAAFQGAIGAEPTIVLCHNPDGKDEMTRHPWDLMLSGHTHGGQVRLGVPTLWAPVRDLRFIAGLYRWQDRQIYISRGVGSPKGLRFGCRPEVSLLEIEPA